MTACGLAWPDPVPWSENHYSLFVFWSKIILPIAAIALLSTLFLFNSDGNDDIPMAEIEAIARESRLSAPHLSGVADDGTLFELGATVAKPIEGKPGQAVIEGIHLNLQASDGTRLDVDAGTAAFDTPNRIVRMDGLARITTSNGYVLETRGLVADLNKSDLTSFGPLEVRAPAGSITAGRIHIYTDAEGEGVQMDFLGGVRLIYTPPK